MNLFCTIVTRSHLPQARVLAETLARSGNPEPLHVLLPDSGSGPLPEDEATLRFHRFTEIANALPALAPYYFDAFELCNALKPFFVARLFAVGARQIIYLDSDILAVGSFTSVWNGFGEASLQLTPHLLRPPGAEATWINESEIVDMGFLNGGFSAWRAGPATDMMLTWFRGVLLVRGFCDRRRGMFVDQKLMPLFLQYFPGDVKVSRDPALNIAFWNAHERHAARDSSGRWTLEGGTAVFFHLSGYRPSSHGKICSYLSEADNTAILRRSPWLAELMADYHALLARHPPEAASHSYPFHHYKGVALSRALRNLLFHVGDLDRSSPAFWRVLLIDRLKSFRRGLLALLRSARP